MANNCLYDMRVKGKKKDVLEFIDILNYKSKICFYRIFSAYQDSEYEYDGDKCAVQITGDCAWSVWLCMFSGDGTYFGEDATKPKKDGTSNILIESKRLNLKIEAKL